MEDQDLPDLLVLQKEPKLPPQGQVFLLELCILANVKPEDLHEAVACEHRHVWVLFRLQFYQDV